MPSPRPAAKANLPGVALGSDAPVASATTRSIFPSLLKSPITGLCNVPTSLGWTWKTNGDVNEIEK